MRQTERRICKIEQQFSSDKPTPFYFQSLKGTIKGTGCEFKNVSGLHEHAKKKGHKHTILFTPILDA